MISDTASVFRDEGQVSRCQRKVKGFLVGSTAIWGVFAAGKRPLQEG